MGRAVKWIKNLLSSSNNKEKEKCKKSNNESRSGPLPMVGPKEKRRWSFRRSSTGTRTTMEHKYSAAAAVRPAALLLEPEEELKRHAVAARAVEDEAAISIQSFFRSHLAKKALCALKGLVKLQALIRGQLVRREATTTLLNMQALVKAQIRARAQRILMLDENNNRRSQDEYRSRQSSEMEENVKTLEIDDHGEYRSSSNSYRRDLRLPTYWGEPYEEVSPAQSNLTDRSPRAISGRFGEYSFSKGSSIPDFRKSSPTVSQDYPNYMANTKSSRAKARSHSAPKQRPSVEGKNNLGGTRHRSSSHQSVKLDRSSISLQESDCGSTSTLLTNSKYCRSLVAYEVRSEVSLNTNS